MSHAIPVNPENPTGTIAPQPTRWPLDDAQGDQVVGFPIVINILIKGSRRHAFMYHDIPTVFSDTGFLVRQTQ